jgi:hypothetical protein
MMDWQWIPGVVAASAAGGHSAWLRMHVSRMTRARVDDLDRQVNAQAAHALMLWPRAWEGGRPLTQVEELAEAGKTWLGEPLDPEEQHRQMAADAARLIGEYERKPDGS